jgi:Ubiquitin 3 binding protein But2 C-terminal domain
MKLLTVGAVMSLLTLSAAVPAPLPQSFPTGSNIVKPSVRSQYEVWTGAILFNTGAGKIFKDGQTTDITTLVTFDFPVASQGKTCEFHFFLDSVATLSGSGLFDVFTSLAPAVQDTTSWPPGNQRNEQVARLSAVQPGEATYVDGFPNTIQSFPCPVGTWAAEFVGVYDVDDIEWSGSGAGSYFEYF